MKSTRRSPLKRILFGRTIVIIFLLALQIYLLFAAWNWLSGYLTIITSAQEVIGLVTVVFIFNRRENPSYKLVWMIPVLVFPIFGTLFYIFVQLNLGTLRERKRIKEISEETKPYRVQNDAVLLKLEQSSPRDARLAEYLYSASGYPVYSGADIRYFSTGEEYFASLKESLAKAEKFIFLEYFFICGGIMWGEVLDILKEKVAEGVDVRVLYDGTTSMSGVHFGYYKKLRKIGIKARVFSPIRPALSTVQNNRDHRKIAVMDGKVAFTGGINLADEYINREIRFGHWKDAGVRVEGEPAEAFTGMFYEMWNAAVRRGDMDVDALAKRLCGLDTQSNDASVSEGFIIPYADSPLDSEAVGENVYFDMLNTAKDYVHIMTPYLIPDASMVSCLTYAAQRGVETMIIMPRIPDKKMVNMLGHSYYGELIDRGVRIFEYKPGFIHSKVVVSDNCKATVGTVNFDYRSFYLHFECGVYMCGCGAVEDVEKDYQSTLEQCAEITREDCKKYPIWKKLIGRALRLIAPLL
ncbi:MAG: cardiolipin synthase [Oscillospiraceae bacterium]|nr:cardiolipin synthase [Oscillospiraceae bacterium]